MPWCPKCKNEYKEGVTVCADCGEPLVDKLPDELEYVFLLSVEEEALAHKFIEYLSYSGLSGKVEQSEDPETADEYKIFVPENEVKHAKKAFQAFYVVEEEAKREAARNVAQTDDTRNATVAETFSNNAQEAEKLSHAGSNAPYVKKSEQYSDYKSTAATFLFFGIGGCILMVLNLLGTISIFNGIVSEIVMSAVFIFFIAVGINSISRAKKAAAESEAEEKMNVTLNNWLEQNLTKETLEKLRDPSISDELNYIHLTDVLKSEIQREFGVTDEAYLDNLIDEYYSDRFDA
ncbi:MAG: zinc ribbon domain-containing protein [Lachnospiraceae bacterium]|nr:zinc ribbon domain-containing protein [Lachnospiraceae bacterium]